MDIAMMAPVGQNQIHINLINHKHRCMRQFFGQSHRYGLWNSLFPIYYNQLDAYGPNLRSRPMGLIKPCPSLIWYDALLCKRTADVSDERTNITSAAAAVNVDDNVVVPRNGDSAAVSFLPAPLLTMAASLSSPSEPSHVVRSASGDSTTRRAAVAALSSNDTQRPTEEEEEEEDRELFIVSYRIFIMLNRYSMEEFFYRLRL